MRTLRVAYAGAVACLLIAGCTQQRTGIEGVADAMGATNLNSIEYSGGGSLYGFGQAYLPGERWPRFFQRSYTVSANYGTPAMRLVSVRAQGEVPPHGGAAQPVAGEQRTEQLVAGTYAWTASGDQPVPNPGAAGDRMRELWATPHGIVKAALANGGTLDGNVISVSIDGRDVKATLNDQNLVAQVRFLNTNEVIGDYPVEIAYSDYADYDGVMFPTHIVRTEDGFPTLDVTIDRVVPNADVSIATPESVVNAPPPPDSPTVQMDMLAPGVWYVTSAGARSWAVEFNDHIVVVEGITGEARSLAVNEAIRNAIPNKPIRYVINTHAHYDHAGGLRTYVAQDATVITHEVNRPFFEEAWARPRTIAPDLLSMSPKAATFETVADRKVLTDGTKTIEIYHLKDSGHNGANLLVYMPNEGLVFWGDGYNPPAGDDPRDPSRTPEYGIDLYRNITQLGLNVRTIAPAHGAGARPYDNLRKAIGVIPP